MYYYGLVVDGLNIAKSGFNWKNRFIFTDSKKPDSNIANIFVNVEDDIRDIERQAEIWGKALELASIFLSCYQLATDRHIPILYERGMTAAKIDGKISVEKFPSFSKSEKSHIPKKISIVETMNGLDKTIPLFEKVIKIIERKKNCPQLCVALILYYESLKTLPSWQNFLNLITALEALFSDGTAEIRYKIALRTALFAETEFSKRKDLFENLKKLYAERSKLVHGGEVSLNPMSKYVLYKVALHKIVRAVLQKYIEDAARGKTKKQIIKDIDSMALNSSF